MSQMQGQTPTPAPQGSAKLVIVAVVLAVAAAVLVNVYITLDRQRHAEATFPVYRLNRSMQRGQTLDRRDIESQPTLVPEQFKSAFPDAIDSEEALANFVGESFEISAATGAVLTREMFRTRTGETDDRAIARSYEQVWLLINPRSVHPGLTPGMYVNIRAPFITGGSRPQVITVLEDVQLKAVGERSIVDESAGSRGRRTYQGVAIDLPPEEAKMISQVQLMTTGDFIISVRNPDDRERTEIPAGGINREVIELVQQRLGSPAAADR